MTNRQGPGDRLADCQEIVMFVKDADGDIHGWRILAGGSAWWEMTGVGAGGRTMAHLHATGEFHRKFKPGDMIEHAFEDSDEVPDDGSVLSAPAGQIGIGAGGRHRLLKVVDGRWLCECGEISFSIRGHEEHMRIALLGRGQ